MKKKIASVLLAAVLLAGCAGGNTPASTPAATSTPRPTATATPGTGATEAPVSSESSMEVEYKASELKIHFHSNNKYTIVDSSGTLLPIYAYASEKTKAKLVNAANPVAQSSSQEFQLQATEKFPADIYGGNSLRSSIYSYAKQGAFLSLNSLIDQYAPNIKKYLDENPAVRKALTDPYGDIYMMPYVPDGEAARAYFIRTDWLDTLGLKMPTNMEELETVLYAFRDNDPNGNGKKDEIPVFNDKWRELIRLANLWGARVYGEDTFEERIVLDLNENLYHAWIHDDFKEALKNMARWYADGIIDPEVFTRKENTARQALWTAENRGGMTHEWIASTSSYNENGELLKTVPNFKVEAMLPISTKGVAFEEHKRAQIKPDGWAISASTKNAEAAIKFMDWWYTEEGRNTINFGIEGDSYTLVDGKPVFTEKVLNAGTVNTYLQTTYGAQYPIGYAQDYEYERQWTNQQGQEAFDLYVNSDVYKYKPTPIFLLTEEEQAIYDEYITVLNTYLDEAVPKFITGVLDVESEWANYVAKCKEYGADKLVEVYESAYARYKAAQ